MFDPYLRLWSLTPDGEPILTKGSCLLPVRSRGEPAMLKVSAEPEERFGAALMTWWDGNGAARVLAQEADALLLERAAGTASLIEMAGGGRDDEASRILCAVAARLHAPRGKEPPPLIPLARRFMDLDAAAAVHGGILLRTAAMARELLASPQDVAVLHGDLHHGNVLDFGARGGLAIDPKGLFGERGFDFANIFCNPDAGIATAKGRLARQASVVADAAKLDRSRLLKWIVAWAGLWFIDDGEDPTAQLAVAAIAAAELDG
jgi:streptomycin 6-kinase